ncbi:uncharacterized protein RAG0_17153 [Rhynchosporium agropyri]|uniref:Uncharacterized protein n=1 Tax=Rhynchosporium agropyri TaxID=914238 RepID=A0A1E1LT59_9HELO|nr:uncharacterized protein RAG0_17153 [Rhynchosporium agropyri]
MSDSTLHSVLSGPDQGGVITTPSRADSDEEVARHPDSSSTESQQLAEENIVSPTSTAIDSENSGTNSQTVTPKAAVTLGTTQIHVSPATTATLHSKQQNIRRVKVLWPKLVTRSHYGKQRNMVLQWGVHWYSPTCMLTLLVHGLVTMLGHHRFNVRFHGREVHDRQWPQRWGLALCSFGKAGYDLLEFLHIELVRRATMMTLLAGLIWILPLCIIISPATLASISTIRNTSTTCDNIQTIEFTHDNNANISAPVESWIVNDGRQGLAYINLMPYIYSILHGSLDEPPTHLHLVTPFQSRTATSHQSLRWWEASQDNPNTFLAQSQLAPHGEAIYTSFTDIIEDEDGAPLDWLFVDATNESTLGTFTKKPSLWIGYVINTTVPVSPYDRSINWPYILERHVLQCKLMNVTYHYDINFLNGLMHIEHSSTTDQVPLLEDGSSTHPLAFNYGDFMGNHAAGFVFRKTLSGTVNQKSAHHWTRLFSLISQTPLLNQTSQYAVSDFPRAISQQFANQIISLCTSPVLYAQINITAPCTTSKTILVWNYKPFWLIISYSLAVFLASLAVIEGLFAFAKNGYSADTNFSTILATTRNLDVDRLAEGMCLGQSPPLRNFPEAKLRFGELKRRGSEQLEAHTTFGLLDDVGPIEFGKKYI